MNNIRNVKVLIVTPQEVSNLAATRIWQADIVLVDDGHTSYILKNRYGSESFATPVFPKIKKGTCHF